MGIAKQISSVTQALFLFAVIACAGSASPGGSSGSTLAEVSSGGASHAVGGGGGGSGDGSGGAVPATQQAEPIAGGPCGIGVQVRVRVIEDGFVRYCDGRQGPRAEFADMAPVNTGVAKAMQFVDLGIATTNLEIYEEPWTYNPKISFDFVPVGTFGEEHALVDATCESDGYWTGWETFRWGYKSSQACADYRLTAKSTMRVEGVHFSSQPFQSGSLPVDSQGYPLPILLIIDKGTTE